MIRSRQASPSTNPVASTEPKRSFVSATCPTPVLPCLSVMEPPPTPSPLSDPYRTCTTPAFALPPTVASGSATTTSP